MAVDAANSIEASNSLERMLGHQLAAAPQGDRTMTKVTTPFLGRCSCGAIRYESTAQPAMMIHCHCRDCQQSSGGPFTSFSSCRRKLSSFCKAHYASMPPPSEMGGMTHRAFALNAARRFWASPTRPLTLSRLELQAWMIRDGSTRK
jgi:hypothetical protein